MDRVGGLLHVARQIVFLLALLSYPYSIVVGFVIVTDHFRGNFQNMCTYGKQTVVSSYTSSFHL